MIELLECQDGRWTWRYLEDGESFPSSKTYGTKDAAGESATRAYPGAKVVVSGLEDRAQPGWPEAPEPQAPDRRERRRRAAEGSPSRLISLIVLVLTYLRSRRGGGGKPGR